VILNDLSFNILRNQEDEKYKIDYFKVILIF